MQPRRAGGGPLPAPRRAGRPRTAVRLVEVALRRAARRGRRGCRSPGRGSRALAAHPVAASSASPSCEDFSGWNCTPKNEPRATTDAKRSPYSARAEHVARRRRAPRRSCARGRRRASSREPSSAARVAALPAHLVPADLRQLQAVRRRARAPRRGRSRGPRRRRARSSARTRAACPRQMPEHRHAGGGALDQEAVERRARAGAPSRSGNAPTPGTTSPAPRASASRVGADEHARRRRARAPSRPTGGCPSRSRRGRSPRGGAARDLQTRPSCSGRPSRSGRSRPRARSARANALNAASIMWCAFPGAWISRWIVQRALLATARKNSSSSSWSKPPVAPGGSSAPSSRNGRPEMSIAHSARASSIGTIASP